MEPRPNLVTRSVGRDSFALPPGILAAGPALLVLVAGGAVLGRGVLEFAADAATRPIPVPLFDALIGLLGPLAKGLLSIAVAVGLLLLGAAGGAVVERSVRATRPRGRRARLLAGASAATGAWLVGALIATVGGAGLLGFEAPDPGALHLPLVLAALAYGAVLAVVVAGPSGAIAAGTGESAGPPPGGRSLPAPASDGFPAIPIARRDLLVRGVHLAAAGSLVAAAVGVLARVAPAVRLPSVGTWSERRALVDAFGVTPAVTPLGDFYVVGISLGPPQVDPASWRFEVRGLVERPATLSLEDLRTAFPRVEGYRTLQCISNPVVDYGKYIGNQRWAGIRFADLLASVGVLPDARFVHWAAADGYSESLPIEDALDAEVWLVDEMGPPGTPLTPEHGFPLRILIPGRYGMKGPKSLTAAVLAPTDEPGYWVVRGWDDRAIVRTYSRIDAPRHDDHLAPGAPLDVYGVASAGDRGISRVEVSTDGGTTWADAELEPTGGPIGRHTWVRWRFRAGDPGPAGSVRILVARATDGRGEVQDAALRDPLPSGATGLHEVRVTVGV